MYEGTAESYSEMMDAEISAPGYADVLDRLHERLTALPGALMDTSCGSGHMLALYAERHGTGRELIGADLTPRMVELARERLAHKATVLCGDMQDLSVHADRCAAGLLSYFALHHLGEAGVKSALQEWHRVLVPGGQLVLAAWEGEGAIDYGASTDIVAFNHSHTMLSSMLEACGYSVQRCKVETIQEMGMDAVYIEATRL